MMSVLISRLSCCAALAVMLCAHAVPAGAQETPASGEQVVARFHAAVGGLGAFTAVQSLHSTGKLAIPAAGISGTVEIWQARPNRSVMHVAVPGFGEVRSGYTGSVGWTVSTTDGPRLMSGAEAVQAADDAHFDSLLRTSELTDTLAFLERTMIDGQECDKVRVVWKTGRVSTDCFASESGLLISSIRSQLAGDNAHEAMILYADYRQFGDIHIPTKVTTRIGDIDQVITLLDVVLNTLDDDVFLPPPAVRDLIRG
jgi:hypothetical protein